MQQQQIIKLTEKYTSGKLSSEEEEQFFQWLKQAGPGEFHSILNESRDVPESFKIFPPISHELLKRIETRLNNSDNGSQFKLYTLKPWKLTAAAALIILSITAYIFRKDLFLTKEHENKIAAIPALQDITPGGNKAVLTLADGSQITLDSAGNGPIGEQGNTRIIKLVDGQLSYKSALATASDAVFYNTISTPKGGQYQITLPDGTIVWLNAVSSIRFPTSFQGNARNVEITGEAYLDVAKDKTKPFTVSAGGVNILVLGTEFNINAYSDENMIKTTLVGGSVKVTKNNTNLLLQAGQQAIAENGSAAVQLKQADIEATIAWKNGVFSFKDAPVEEIMRQLSRWYNLEIEYKGKVNTRFRTIIPRNAPVSQVLRVLESTQAVHFEVAGNKVIVKP